MITNEQQSRIASYCYLSGVIYYDVELEVIDHMTEWIEQDMAVHHFSFDESLERMKKAFTGKDCVAIITSKSKAVRGRIWRNFVQEFISYFSWPKITVLFLMAVVIYMIDRYTNVAKFPNYAIHIINIFNATILYGRGKIIGQNRQDKVVKMISWRQISMMQILIVILPVAYLLFSLVASSKTLPLIACQVMLYSFPLILLILLAWRKVSITLHEKLRQDYPGAFAN